ncbi:hypothetical protein IGI04_029528, partial [Brassica rapa subsp. trilocularis]
MTITSCLLALFLRLSCEKHMKGWSFFRLRKGQQLVLRQAHLIFNPSPAASHVQNPAEKPREFQREREKEEQKKSKKIGGDLIFNLSSVCYLEKDQKPQAYLGEEDQLRPFSPLVHLGKLWSLTSVRGRVKLEVSSPVHSVSWSIQPCSSGTQVLSKPVSRLIF